MNEEELGARVAEEYSQQFEGTVEGPVCIGIFTAHRVWTYDGKQYHAHYAIQRRGHPLKVYQNFLPFAGWLDKEFDLDARANRGMGWVRIGIAAVVVLVALGLVTYLIIDRPEQSSVITYLLTALVGGAAGVMFGRWSRAPAKAEEGK